MAKKTNFHERVGMKIKEVREKCGETISGLSKNSGLIKRECSAINRSWEKRYKSK